MSDIQKTKDYKKFKFLECNRKLDLLHVDRLADAISQRNLLEFEPIIVDENLNILDGQHRLKAAEKLGISVFYRVTYSTKVEDIITFQLNKKSWKNEDYLNFYCVQQKNPDYIKLQDFVKKENLSIASALMLLGHTKNSKLSKDFKNGSFKMPMDLQVLNTLPRCKEVIEYITRINGICRFVQTSLFLKALAVFLTSEGVEFKKFMEALPRHVSTLTPQVTQQAYIDKWVNIYNWGKGKNNKIEVNNDHY